MLAELRIQHLAVVENLSATFKPGLNVISGETGAGKSLLLGAVELALGGKGRTQVGEGSDRGEVFAVFDPPAAHPVRQRLEDQGFNRDGEIILGRVLFATGRSRATLNDRPVTLEVLAEIGSMLVETTGQDAQIGLLSGAAQRAVLDRFAGAGSVVAEVAQAAKGWRQAQRDLEALREAAKSQNERREILAHRLNALEALAPQPDEIETLRGQRERLRHARQIVEAVEAAREGLDRAIPDLETCAGALDQAIRWDEGLREAAELLNQAQTFAEEALRALPRLEDEENGPSLETIEERLFALSDWSRRLGCPPEELPQALTQVQEEFAGLEHIDDTLRGAEKRLDLAEQTWREAAARLSALRRKSAPLLARAVQARLQALNLGGGSFSVDLNDEGVLGDPHGFETATFRFQSHPGLPAGPLAAVASGGERSRLLLALKLALGEGHAIPTSIFDEVDVGIGGPTAGAVGKLLRELGERRQVVSITHLAPVAACGHSQIVVGRDGERPLLAVTMVDGAERVRELARMLGDPNAPSALEHAQSLLNLAP